MGTASRLYWEILPIILALATIFYCGFRFLVATKSAVRNDSAAAVVVAMIMIVAQVSWSWSVFIKQDHFGTDIANIIWTLFNSLVMLKFMYTAYWNKQS